ncbi:uncharacterized protein LOC124814978 [Hydra vulgaris]|uniref:uncharacterized protein LOC124814978 n=1 Tax=Hydra vulgaris TaxID=6087 RepID=UPI001F5E84A5|nr:uncharacterized protein LOC124814978 [Hydra vulgaris]
MDEELSSSKSKICNLMSELSILNVGTIEWFVSDEKFFFYTGLPNMDVFFTLFKFIRSFLLCKRSKLSDFQHLSLTLMRLRLNLTLNDLAYRYNVSITTASSVFLKTIDVLYHVHKHSYKHHNTVKFLIGIVPQGVVSFISKSWGGRVSDKYLTENCGFLSKLLPGDVVLADRGLSIEDSIAFVQSTIPLDYLIKQNNGLTTMDKIVTISCSLINLNDSVIPFD